MIIAAAYDTSISYKDLRADEVVNLLDMRGCAYAKARAKELAIVINNDLDKRYVSTRSCAL